MLNQKTVLKWHMVKVNSLLSARGMVKGKFCSITIIFQVISIKKATSENKAFLKEIETGIHIFSSCFKAYFNHDW